MIHFNFALRNPFWNNRWANIKCWHPKPKNNRSWEVQIMKTQDLVCLQLDWTTRCDHAGITLELGLAGYSVNFSLYDTRHWHPEKNRWVNYDDPSELEELYGKSGNK